MGDTKTHENEIEDDRQLIRRSRKSVEEASRHFLDSVDRLVESQKRLRDIDKKRNPETTPKS